MTPSRVTPGGSDGPIPSESSPVWQECDGEGAEQSAIRNPQSAVLSDFQLAEWQRRQSLVQAMLAARVGEKGGASFGQIARATGEPVATLHRYFKAYVAGEESAAGAGWEALRPDIGSGRPPKFDLTRDEALCLKAHHLQRGSLALAVQWFVKGCTHRGTGGQCAHTGCRPATRALILAEQDRAARERTEERWPVSLRRAGHVTAEEKATFRGRKAMQDFESCDRRGLTWIDETGAEQELRPGTLFESDDMSSNEPCHFTDPETGIPRGGRQILFTGDVFSNAYLGATALGRERDAYRVEDIADHLLAVVEAHGMPLAWRLERGVWENQFTDGIPVEHLTGNKDQVWGGLDALFAIVRTWKSRGKGAIESSFNLLQALIAHESTSIGRHRGEFEHGTKLWLAAHRATALAEKWHRDDPRSARTAEAIAAAFAAWQPFWGMDVMGDAYAQACDLFNHRPKKRRAHGRALVVPADQFRDAAQSTRTLPESERWRFCPVKRCATVRQGAVELSVEHYPMPFRFRVNGIADRGLRIADGGRAAGAEQSQIPNPQSEIYLEHGTAVLVAFHPGKPELGCHVFNAELGPRNRDGWKFGELLLTAPLAEDAPQFSLSRAEQQAFADRRRAAAAVRSEFRAILPAGRMPVRVSVARDGRGNSAEFRNSNTQGDDVSRTRLREETAQPNTGGRGAATAASERRAGTDYDALAGELAAEEAERLAHALPE